MDNNWQEWKERIVGYTRKIKQADRGQKRTRLAILFLCGLLLSVSCGSGSEDRGDG